MLESVKGYTMFDEVFTDRCHREEAVWREPCLAQAANSAPVGDGFMFDHVCHHSILFKP